MKWMAAAAFSVALLSAQTSRGALSVTAVRHWSLGDTTRVAIEISGEFEYRTDRLHNPERVYYDIPNSRPLFDGKRIYSESLGDPFVTRIRIAETAPGIT